MSPVVRYIVFGSIPYSLLSVHLPINTTLRIPSVRSKLRELLQEDLDFHRSGSLYASHGFHPFSAKFPPQLPRLFIEELTVSGDTVLDPMMGSGTTMVEALLLHREAFGFDLDPLAVKLCRVKTRKINPKGLDEVGQEILSLVNKHISTPARLNRMLKSRFDRKSLEFLDYWFLKDTQQELLSLMMAIEATTEDYVREFFELIFSSTIIAKWGGVSLARDLAHSRPHRDLKKTPRNAFLEFSSKLRKVLRRFDNIPPRINSVHLQRRDARNLPVPSNSIDLVVTSPPYANAIDYMRAHKFSLIWLGYSVDELSSLRGCNIGSERIGRHSAPALPRQAERLIEKLQERDKQKARIVRKYLCEMREALHEIARVLRNGRAAILVVGPSMMRGIQVETHNLIATLGETVGLEILGIKERKIDRDRRMLPISFGRNGDSTIEQRMHREFVVGFLKS